MSVADLLVPNPYPLNISAASLTNLTVTNLTVTGSINASSNPNNFTAPITITSSSTQLLARCPAGGVAEIFLGGPIIANGTGSLRIDTSVSPPMMTILGGPFTGLNFATSGLTRFSIPPGGILNSESSSAALALNGSSELVTKTVTEGTFTPTWTTLVGFTAGPSSTYGKYIRIGNMVHVTATIAGMTSGGGPTSSGTITLPIAPAALFATASDLTGVATMDVGANNATIGPTLAAFTATIAVLTGGVISGDISVTFMYSIA